MAFDQTTRPLRLKIDGIDATAIAIIRFTGTEYISHDYEYELEFVSEVNGEKLLFESILGKSAIVEIDRGEGEVRHVHGVIRRLSQGKRGGRLQYFQAVLVPQLSLLSFNTQSRIFQELTVPEILKVVIGGLYSPEMDQLQDPYPNRNFTVQYRESDFTFISRLMEEEGIYYYFTQSPETQGLVIADNPQGHQKLPFGDVLIFDDNQTATEGAGRVTHWQKVQELRVGAYQLSDHNFELPTNGLDMLALPLDSVRIGTVEHQLSIPATSKTAVVDDPGGYGWWRDGISPGGAERPDDLQDLFQENSRISGRRMDYETVSSVKIHGESTCCCITAGHRFELIGHHDADGEYVLTSVTHQAELGPDAVSDANPFRYSNQFTCIPLGLPFRPERHTEKPTIRGTQTADVVGSDDAEIDPDKYGRVKVHFRWDPAGVRGLDTSCWVRVAQFWAGKNWGAQFLPRVGDEVIVAFLEGDPNRPIIIGSVYHADNMPIYALPENKTKSGIKTHSSPKGTTANYNEIFFEDKIGNELISIHAENNMSTHVENSYTLTVGSYSQSSGADVHKLGKSTTQVYGDTKLNVTDGDYDVGIDKGKITVFANKTIEVQSKTDFIHVESPTQINLNVYGTAIADITPGQIKLSVGDSTFITMTNDTIHLHAANIKIDGTATTKINTPDFDCFGKVSFIHAANMKIQGTADAKLLSPDVTITGDTKVTVTGGGSKVELVAAGATMSGATAKVHGDGITTVEGSTVKVNC